MYKALLIDDEPLARSLLKKLLEQHPSIEVAGECANGFEGVKMTGLLKPDLIFLDIQMPRLSGFEMLELLDVVPGVIFTTAFDEYALRAFETNAIDYLLKPVTAARFDIAVQKWLRQAATATKDAANKNVAPFYELPASRIVIKDKGAIHIIEAAVILYLEADDDYVRIHTKEKIHLKKDTLTRLEKVLEAAGFVRVHRSYIVPSGAVVAIDPYEKESHIARLQHGASIPVSKSGLAKLKAVLRW